MYVSTNYHVFLKDWLMYNSTISSTSLHRDLGILVSSNLTWDNHYSAIISKAYRALYFIRRATSHSLLLKLNCLSTKVWLDRTSLIAPKYGVLTK